jgi:hypothetical protein
MYGEQIGEGWTARRADLRDFTSGSKLPVDSEIKDLRYVIVTDSGMIWSPPVIAENGFKTVRITLGRHLRILNVILADRLHKRLVKCGGNFPIELLPGQTFSWVNDHALVS